MCKYKKNFIKIAFFHLLFVPLRNFLKERM